MVIQSWASSVAQSIKSLPAMQETQIRSLDQEDSLEKEMATHSSILAWKIPWAEEPGRLQSMGVTRVGHDLVTKPPPRGLDGKESVCSAGRRPEFNPWVRKIPWRSEQLPIPVFLPREFHGQRSLAGYSPWCHKELDMTSDQHFYFHPCLRNLPLTPQKTYIPPWHNISFWTNNIFFQCFNIVTYKPWS